jgi:hypothetical protein
MVVFEQAGASCPTRRAAREFLVHYHRERNRQGLENRLIEPPSWLDTRDWSLRQRERLGGMLSYYYRPAACGTSIAQVHRTPLRLCAPHTDPH